MNGLAQVCLGNNPVIAAMQRILKRVAKSGSCVPSRSSSHHVFNIEGIICGRQSGYLPRMTNFGLE
jgi:hypothetical protein